MKRLGKFLCFALAAMMIFSSFAVVTASSFPDVDDSAAYAKAVDVLSNLGIIKGFDDGQFKPAQNVTRAEFTAMLMRTMNMSGIGSTSSSALPFSDLPDDDASISWAYPDINTAYGSGIINGYEDGTFRPNDNVAYEEALKMIVCALGYGTVCDVSKTPWYTDYVSQASQLLITKTADGAVETPASRACIAQFIYNMLEVNIVENDVKTTKTPLNDWLGYTKNSGIIAANNKTSITSPESDLRAGEVQILAVDPGASAQTVSTYLTSDTSYASMIGYEVEFYYSTDRSGVRTLVACEFSGNTSVKIDVNEIDLDTTTDSSIKYYKDGAKNTTSLALSSDNFVIYNEMLYGYNQSSSRFSTSMIPDVGAITLLDSNNDGKYDMLTIEAYEVYYVSSKVSAEYKIIDDKTRLTDERTLTLDPDNNDVELTIVNESGSTTSFASISTGNVVCYAESNDNGATKIAKAVVVTNSITGSISSVQSNESITINGTVYKYSSAAPWKKAEHNTAYADLQTAPKASTNGKFMLDLNGDVVCYDESVTEVNQSYGYIVGASTPTGGFDDIDNFQIRILTSSGSMTNYYMYNKTKVNGVTCSTPTQVYNALEQTANGSYQNQYNNSRLSVQQAIKYETRTSNGKTVLSNIYTANSDSVTTGSGVTSLSTDSLNVYGAANGADMLTYKSSTRQLSNSSGAKINIGSAYIFIVPEARNTSDGYKKGSTSNFKDGKTYYVEAFDIVSSGAAKVVVLYSENATQGIDADSPVYVLDSVAEAVNSSENTTMARIKGTSITSTSAGSFDDWVSDDSYSLATDLSKGDIFRVGSDNDGYTTLENNANTISGSAKRGMLYKKGWTDGYVYTEDLAGETDYSKTDMTVVFGSLISNDKDNKVMNIAPRILAAGEDYSGDQYSFGSFTSSTKVLSYDLGTSPNTTVTDVSSDYNSALFGGELVAYEDGFGLQPTPMLIYASEGRVRLVVIFNNMEL